tara:strand:- start:765 stop:941 length:177 start_codon:yes stop_codon:yes gene_type:complete
MLPYLLAIIILFSILVLMALGSLFFNKELKGSCGGENTSCDCTAVQKKMCSIKNQINS